MLNYHLNSQNLKIRIIRQELIIDHSRPHGDRSNGRPLGLSLELLWFDPT